MSRIEDEVCFKILERAKVGKDKYGTTMERDDLSVLEWLKHTQEELMDACVYIEKLIDEKEKEQPCKNCSRESGIPKWTRTSSLEEFETKKCQRCGV